MLTYPVTLTPDDGSYLVTSPDFPELTTFGDTEEDALIYAAGAFDEAIAARIADRQAIPSPSKTRRGQKLVTLSARTEIKVALYRQMRARKMSKAELGRTLAKHPAQIDRILDVRHGSTVEQLEEALRAVGLRLSVEPERGRHQAAA